MCEDHGDVRGGGGRARQVGRRERRGRAEGSPVVAMAPKVAELPTRVSRAAARRVETPAERVTLIDLQPSGDPPQGE